MPINLNYDWIETDSIVRIEIQLPEKITAEVFISEWYVKVNCSSGLLSLDLYSSIDDVNEQTLYYRTSDTLIVVLLKSLKSVWGRLTVDSNSISAIDLKRRRDGSILKRIKDDEKKAHSVTLEKNRQLKASETHQWNLDSKQKKSIENWKETEKLKAVESLYLNDQSFADSERSVSLESEQISTNIRNSSKIQIHFSERATPGAPARNRSIDPPKAKKMEAVPVIENESSPAWLKDQGDNLTAKGDYAGAYRAYTEVINCTATPSDIKVKALANRSITLIILGRLVQAREDCLSALSFLDGTYDMFSDLLRVALKGRLSLCALYSGDLQEAYELSVECALIGGRLPIIHKEIKLFENDRNVLKKNLESVPQKKEADSFFRDKNYSKAESIYEQLKSIENPIILGNLAISKMLQDDFNGCLEESKNAIELLSSCLNFEVKPPNKFLNRALAAYSHPKLLNPLDLIVKRETDSKSNWLMRQEGVNDECLLPPLDYHWEWKRDGAEAWVAIRKTLSQTEKLNIENGMNMLSQIIPKAIKASAHEMQLISNELEAIKDMFNNATEPYKQVEGFIKELALVKSLQEAECEEDSLQKDGFISDHPVKKTVNSLIGKALQRIEHVQVKC